MGTLFSHALSAAAAPTLHRSLLQMGKISNLNRVNPARHLDWIFCDLAQHFCHNTEVFNTAAFSLPLFSIVSSLKLRKWYMILYNDIENTSCKIRIVKMAVSSNL